MTKDKEPQALSEEKVKTPLLKRNWLVISSLIILPPLGVILTWFTQWPRNNKIFATVLSLLWFLMLPSLEDSGTQKTSRSQEVTSEISQSESEGQDSQSDSIPTPDPMPTSTPLGVFTNVREDRALQVNGSEFFDSIHANNPFADAVNSKGGKLVAVYLTIKNTGNRSGDMFWTEFTLTDSQGRVFDEIQDFTEMLTIDMWAEEKGLDNPGDQVFPGGTARTVKVFRVSPDAQTLTLTVNRQSFSID